MKTEFTPEQLADPKIARSNEVLRTCVHCGFCTATCPTYQVLGDERDSPRGRIYLIKDMLEKGRPADEKTVKHIDRCLSCLACMTTCPSGVHYMHLVDHAREYIEQTYRRPLFERMLRWTLAPMQIPPVSRNDDPQVFPAEGERKMRVALMTGCAQRALNTDINDATIRLLTRLGCDVVIAEGQGCCGALTHHMGKTQESHATAAKNIQAWHREMTGEGLDAVVINTSGCGTTVKDYGHMFRNEALAGEAKAVSEIAMDVSEVLMKLDLPEGAPKGLKIAYHAACSLQHGQQIKTYPKDLLKRAGFKVSEPVDSHLCCGSAGTYNLMQPEISGQLKARKVETLEMTRPDIIAAGNIGCMMQIGSGTGIPIVHTAELLDGATGWPRPPPVDAPGKRELAVPILR